MAKLKEFDINETDELCSLGKALSSPVRLEILGLLYDQSMIIEIGRASCRERV